MNYRSIDLSIAPKEARQRISNRVSGISVTTSVDSIEFRTSTGIHLAILSEVRLPDGATGSRLKYRTAIISPAVAHARRKATEIRSAVDEHQY